MSRQIRARTRTRDPHGPDHDAPRLRLEPRLDLSAAPALLEALLRAKGRDLVLDGREVRHLGGPGLQVLLAARRSWVGDGRALSIEEPSEELLEGLERLGATIEAVTVEGAT